MRREQANTGIRISITEATRIRQWALNRSIKQEDIAKHIGVSLGTLRNALSGTGTLKPDVHAKLMGHTKP